MISRPALFILILAWSAGAFAGQSRLTGIRYNIRGSNSRVTLLFTDAILYSANKTPDGVMLMLRNTEIGSPPGEAKLDFKSGNVRRVEVTKVGKDSAAVSIVMRNGGRVEYSSSEVSHQLYVDVNGTQLGAPAGLSSKLESARGKKHVSPLPPVAKGEDLRVVGNPIAEAQMEPPTADPTGGRNASSTGATILAVIISVIIGGIGTLTILSLYVRQRLVPRPQQQRMEETEGGMSQTQFSIPPPPAIPFVSQAEEKAVLAEDDSSLSLAERFQRSRGEIDFALHLSSGAYGHERGKKLAGTNPAALTGAQRAVVAKRLGVGQGEVELMAKISRMKQHGMEERHD